MKTLIFPLIFLVFLNLAHAAAPRTILALGDSITEGYGVEKAENKEGFHGKAFSEQELQTLLPLMEKRFNGIAHFGCLICFLQKGLM